MLYIWRMEAKQNPVILCTAKDSHYLNLGLECYDKKRDALTFNASNVVITHPPCRSFGRLRHLVTAENKAQDFTLATFCVNKVRQNGGILEHPAFSKLFNAEIDGLPYPHHKEDIYGGFTLHINQHWFGHKAEKRTWLYVVGCSKNDLPKMPLSFDAITHIVGTPRTNLAQKELSKKERHLTPENLCLWLVQVANIIADKKRANLALLDAVKSTS